MVHRDDPAIADSVRALIRNDGFEATLDSVTRFSLLAYAPSEHARAALLGLEALSSLRDLLPADVAEEQLIHLARYAAGARRPWSEAPITDPPPHQAEDGSDETLAAAVALRDRLAGERWLAACLRGDDPAQRFLVTAANIRSGLHEPLRISAACSRLARSIPPQFHFAVLRTAVVEWTAGHSYEEITPSAGEIDPALQASRLIRCYAEKEGAPTRLAEIAGLDAACYVHETTGEAKVLQLFSSEAAEVLPSAPESHGEERPIEFPGTPAQVDFSGALVAWSIAERRRNVWDQDDLALMKSAASAAAREERWLETWSL